MAPMRVLITGSPDRVAALSQCFTEAGDEALTRTDLGPGSGDIQCYVQLGTTVPVRGETVVARVHSFLSDGLLERFTAAERVLARLADGAAVLLVAGNQSAETAAPDDQAARLLLLRVLAHAVRADVAPNRVRVRLINGDRTDAEIVEFAHSGAKDPTTVIGGSPASFTAGSSYEDWRIEVMGLVHVQS